MIVTVLCRKCSGYFRMEAFDEGDLKNPICCDCAERLCAHLNAYVERFDAGRCAETGYSDAGERIVCRDCGFREVA